ncbi:RNA polymerase sigma factor [soil metagenome]
MLPSNTTSIKQAAFMELLLPLQRRLEKFAYSMTHDEDEAKDLVQDTILSAWQHFDNVRDHAAFRSYLFSICSNSYKRKYTRAKLFGLFTEDLHETLASSTLAPDDATDTVFVYQALAKLPYKYREALIMHEITGLTVEEIRAVQGGTASAIKVRLMRGRKMLAKLLGVHSEHSLSVQPAPSKGF